MGADFPFDRLHLDDRGVGRVPGWTRGHYNIWIHDSFADDTYLSAALQRLVLVQAVLL